MRRLAAWEIDSLRRQHLDCPIKKGHEARDDTEPRNRRMLTDEELASIHSPDLSAGRAYSEFNPLNGIPTGRDAWPKLPYPDASTGARAASPRPCYSVDPNRTHEDLERDMDATKQWLNDRIRPLMPPTMGERLARSIISTVHCNPHNRDLLIFDLCTRALKAQDELIAMYQQFEIDRQRLEVRRHVFCTCGHKENDHG